MKIYKKLSHKNAIKKSGGSFFNAYWKPDKNPKPDYDRPEPDFQMRLKPEPYPNPIRENPSPPEPDLLKPAVSLNERLR